MENKQHVDTNKSEQNLAKNDTENLKIIAFLEDKVQTIVAENLQYGKRIKNEKQKWQEALNMKIRQIKMFKIKIQKLRKLQIQKKKKMERNIKILKAEIEKLKKNYSNKDLIRVLSEIHTADLTAKFKKVYEPLKQSGYKIDVKDAIQYLEATRAFIRLLVIACSGSSISSAMHEMDCIESEEDMDKEKLKKNYSYKDLIRVLDKICTANLTTQFKEVFEPLKGSGYKFDGNDVIEYLELKSSLIKMNDKKSEKDMDKESMEDVAKESEKAVAKESEKDVAKESEKDMKKKKKKKISEKE